MGCKCVLGNASAPGTVWIAKRNAMGSALLLLWRLVMRFAFVTRAYGLREGMRAVPRAVVGNVIAVMAARRAVGIYLRMRRDGVVHWDKTAHHFPAAVSAE